MSAGTSSNTAPKADTKSAPTKNKLGGVQIIEPPNPTDNWRETDRKTIHDINVDKSKFAAKKKSRMSYSQNDLRSKGAAIAAGGFAIGIVELEVVPVAVIVSASDPGFSLGNAGIVAPPGKPFDPAILDDPEVLALTLPDPDSPDYVTCPHCGRRFEPLHAAPRHIAQCKDTYYNQEEKDRFQKTRKSVAKLDPAKKK